MNSLEQRTINKLMLDTTKKYLKSWSQCHYQTYKGRN